MTTSKAVRSALRSARVAFFVSIWFTLLTLVAVWYLTTAVLLVLAPVAGVVSLALLLATLLVPLETKVPRAVEWLLERSVAAFIEYLPVEVSLHECWKEERTNDDKVDADETYEMKSERKNDRKSERKNDGEKKAPPYVIAYEPHGVLPLIMCIFAGSVRKPASLGLPRQLDHAAILASDAVFWVPILRNLWYWLGLRSVSRESIDRLLDEEKTSIVLCPGGITECLVMQPYNEAVYLRRRKGFVRMAKKHGASIVPVFGVGQSEMYSYWRPLYDAPSTAWTRRMFVRMSKLLRFVPMVAWGRAFTPLPYRKRVKVVIGAPIAVGDGDGDGGVEEGLETYIERLGAMYEGAEGRRKGSKVMVVH